MNLSKSLAVAIFCLGVAAIGVSLAQHPPAQNVIAGRHLNPATAQRLHDHANHKLRPTAQAANKNGK
jgi:hypothetical protein